MLFTLFAPRERRRENGSSDIDAVVFDQDLRRLSNGLAVLSVRSTPRIVNSNGVESPRM